VSLYRRYVDTTNSSRREELNLICDTNTVLRVIFQQFAFGLLRWLLLCMIQGLVLIRDGWELLSLDWQS